MSYIARKTQLGRFWLVGHLLASKASEGCDAQPLEGEILHGGDSVADLRSEHCRTREEHETCFEGPECAAKGF